jgi:MFS family permease
VSYLSLFYTRFEFGRRLSLFYGQAAVGGALGGLLSYLVFSHFPKDLEDHHGENDPEHNSRWQSWQVLFLLEGSLTMIVAVIGYFWLPHSIETAWFLTPEERQYASQRIIQDRLSQVESAVVNHEEAEEDEHTHDEESRGLLNASTTKLRTHTDFSVTDDRGLSPHEIVSAFLSPRIWHILLCNTLSAVPVYAFQVFLPLVLAPLTDSPNPALVNLMTAPPYICGAITLYLFARYSDKHRKRILPILAGLALLLTGLTLVVFMPTSKPWAPLRYMALNILLSGCFIASPLTVAWISGNTPSPGKRALLLGINGWGNLAGVFSALLFRPKYAADSYIVPFFWTLLCVALAAVGYVLFYLSLQRENRRRKALLRLWDAVDVDRERVDGSGPLRDQHRILHGIAVWVRGTGRLKGVVEWLGEAIEGGREGDEKISFEYGL